MYLTCSKKLTGRSAYNGSLSLFLSRVSILTRDIDIANLSVCLSVRPSVRYVRGSDENGLTYRQFFHHYSFTSIKHFHKIPMGPPLRGAKYRWGSKIRDFLPISRYISQTIQNIAIVTMEGE